MEAKRDAADAAADTLRYQSGFGNQFASEALPGALPIGRNSPQNELISEIWQVPVDGSAAAKIDFPPSSGRQPQ